MEFDKQQSSLSLKQELKNICSSCCNLCDCEEEDEEIEKPLEQQHYSSPTEKRRSLTKWLKSELAQVFSSKHGRNRRCNSSEFKYDPFSYALNFEDDDSHLDQFPLRDFSSRLPPSPVKQNNIYNSNNNNVVVSTQKSIWS